MKIAVIGGGSTYTPEVIEGLLQKHERLGLSEVVLMDIDAERLAVVGAFARRMVRHAGGGFEVRTTTDRAAAIEGAQFVLTQIRVGGQEARHQDILLGLRHGLIGQETTGIGGMAKALRTLPVILDVCRDVERLAPEAWMVNFTNPSGLITEAILNHTRVRCIGLCNIPIEMKMTVARHLGVPEEDVRIEIVGLNHLGWVRRVFVRGNDITPGLIEFLAGAEGPKNIPDLDYAPDLIRALGAVPLWYNRYYYSTGRALEELRKKDRTRAQEVMEIEAELLSKYRDPAVVTKPAELGKRGGAYYSKIAVEVIDALTNDLGTEHVVNIQNRGAIPDLPPHNVVEIAARVGKDGATPIPVAPLEPSMRALVQQAKAYEELTIEAAIRRSWSAAYRAIFTNPLGPRAENAREVLEDLLRTNGLQYS